MVCFSMDMLLKWSWIPLSVALAVLAACGSSSSETSLEELPHQYYGALAEDQWLKAWDLSSAHAKELCTTDYFIESREWFKEESGESYDFWLNAFRELSEGEWEAEISGSTATLRLAGTEAVVKATLEDGSWRVADSGEYQTCLPFHP